MTISPWPADRAATTQQLTEQLAASEAMVDLLVEDASTAALELAAEDRGWASAALRLEHDFSREGIGRIVRNCVVMSIASPLVKRALQLRAGYVWGQGVSIQARAGEADAQDVNAVLQGFLDDEGNQKAFTSAQAREQAERTLGTEGNWFLAFFPDPTTGHVQVRTVPFAEILDKHTNPDDRDEDWFFLREYAVTIIEPGFIPGTTRSRWERRRVLHPALGYWPVQRPKAIDNIPVQWDQPILHVTVNKPAHAKWGIPDAYAALPWARAYEEFLTDWAKLVKALSKFAWRLTGDRGRKVQAAADKVRASLPLPGSDVPGMGSTAGATAAMGPGANLEAIPKSGATIDSESGRPLAAMVAAAFGISVVSLLADPGVTGARAVAETLDKPEVLEMSMRQELWASVIRRVAGYVVDQAVKAPSGPLQGTTTVDAASGRQTTILAGDVDRTIEVVFPDLNELDPVALVNAIVAASGTQTLPEPWIAKALLRALGEQNVDEVIDPMLDDQGNWISPTASAGAAAAEAHRRGQDPASAVYGA